MTQLFTDTSANLPIGLALQHKIKILPFSYTVNGVEQPYLTVRPIIMPLRQGPR